MIPVNPFLRTLVVLASVGGGLGLVMVLAGSRTPEMFGFGLVVLSIAVLALFSYLIVAGIRWQPYIPAPEDE